MKNVEKDELRKIENEMGGVIENWIISKENLKIYFNNREFVTKNELVSYYINKYKI